VEEVAHAVLDALRARRRTLFVPGHLRLLSCLAEVAPGLADRLIVRAVEREARRR
jgi:hypothetical protein